MHLPLLCILALFLQSAELFKLHAMYVHSCKLRKARHLYDMLDIQGHCTKGAGCRMKDCTSCFLFALSAVSFLVQGMQAIVSKVNLIVQGAAQWKRISTLSTAAAAAAQFFNARCI